MKYLLIFLFLWQAAQAQSLTMRVAFQPEYFKIKYIPLLFYELHVKNAGSDTVRIKKVEVLNATNLKLIEAFKHKQALAPGDSTIIYIELGVENTSTPLIHRINKEKGAPLEKLPVSSLVLGPPLGAGSWAAIWNADWERGHRRVVYTVNDSARIPGRYAIDFILLNDEGHYAKGNEDSIRNWYGYGAPVLAVADAVVAAVVDTVTESAAISKQGPVSASGASGNYIALDLGDSRYAFYEHLQPGSAKVKPGERVQKGQVIAALGFTGQSTGPHLHFHVANRLSTLGGEGIPYLFEAFNIIGIYYGKFEEQFGKEKWRRPPDTIIRKKKNAYPMPLTIITFK